MEQKRLWKKYLRKMIELCQEKGIEILLTYIPYGGIICALTWGVIHIATKGNIVIGMVSMFLGFMFGSAYLLLKRDAIKTVIVLFLMFIL